MELLLMATFLSLDNVRLSFGLGFLAVERRKWWRLAFLMAAAEAGFLLIGASASFALLEDAALVEFMGPGLLFVAALFTVAGVAGGKRFRSAPLLWILPFLFGIDNLLAGAAVGISGQSLFASVALVGLVSALISLMAMGVARAIGKPLQRLGSYVPSLGAAAIAASSFLLL